MYAILTVPPLCVSCITYEFFVEFLRPTFTRTVDLFKTYQSQYQLLQSSSNISLSDSKWEYSASQSSNNCSPSPRCSLLFSQKESCHIIRILNILIGFLFRFWKPSWPSKRLALAKCNRTLKVSSFWYSIRVRLHDMVSFRARHCMLQMHMINRNEVSWKSTSSIFRDLASFFFFISRY